MDDGRAGKHNAAPRFNGVLDAVRVHDEVVGDDERIVKSSFQRSLRCLPGLRQAMTDEPTAAQQDEVVRLRAELEVSCASLSNWFTSLLV